MGKSDHYCQSPFVVVMKLMARCHEVSISEDNYPRCKDSEGKKWGVPFNVLIRDLCCICLVAHDLRRIRERESVFQDIFA